jgi:hypothetical protein
MGKQKIFKRMKISDKHIIASVIIAIVILMGILFRVQIGSMFRSIFGSEEWKGNRAYRYKYNIGSWKKLFA